MLTIEQRQRYAPGVGVAWVFLPALIVLSLLAGLGLAWGLKLAYYHDWYLILLLPIVGGFALGGVLYLLVGWARCRNRWLAAALGVVAGLIGYLGYYELCLLDIVPPELACRADFLTHYIKLRMQTDVARDLGAPNDPQANQKPSAGLNWYSFFCELLMVSGRGAQAVLRMRTRGTTGLLPGTWAMDAAGDGPASARVGPGVSRGDGDGESGGFRGRYDAGQQCADRVAVRRRVCSSSGRIRVGLSGVPVA